MSRARKNRDLNVDPRVNLTAEELRRGASAYEKWHWGIPATDVMDVSDPDMPPCHNGHRGACSKQCKCALIGIGRLIRLQFRAPRAISQPHPRRKRDSMIQFSRDLSSNAFVAYDPDDSGERLYLIIPSQATSVLKRRFWDENPLDEMPLGRAAKIAGGRHARPESYPDVHVKPVGVLTAIVYFTHKKGDENEKDERSFYLHKLGELTHFYPFLCCDNRGRMFVAGGNYTAPTPGITD